VESVCSVVESGWKVAGKSDSRNGQYDGYKYEHPIHDYSGGNCVSVNWQTTDAESNYRSDTYSAFIYGPLTTGGRGVGPRSVLRWKHARLLVARKTRCLPGATSAARIVCPCHCHRVGLVCVSLSSSARASCCRWCYIKMSPPWKIRSGKDDHGTDMFPLINIAGPIIGLPPRKASPPSGADFYR